MSWNLFLLNRTLTFSLKQVILVCTLATAQIKTMTQRSCHNSLVKIKTISVKSSAVSSMSYHFDLKSFYSPDNY